MPAKAQKKRDIKTGKASFYAKRFHKRKTASGALYHHDAFTCAHRTYPFGTKLLVRNPHNEKTVVVEVNDRGPFKKGRIIDLSLAAAKEIEMIDQGIILVEVSEHIALPKEKVLIPRIKHDKVKLLSANKISLPVLDEFLASND